MTYDEFLRDFWTQPYYPIVTIDTDGSFKQRSVIPTLNHKWNIPLFVWNKQFGKQQIYWLRKSKSSFWTIYSFLDGSLCLPRLTQMYPGTIFNYHGLSFASIQYTAGYWEQLLKLDYRRIDEHTILGLLVDLSVDYNLET